jgi:hypothetical protein
MDIDKTISSKNTKDIITDLETGLKLWHRAKGSTDPEEEYSWEYAAVLPNILISVFSG